MNHGLATDRLPQDPSVRMGSVCLGGPMNSTAGSEVRGL